MITKEQALTANEFHYADRCVRTVGPRGGVTEKFEVWRRNGQTKLWVTRPQEFRIPVKYGLYAYASITETEAHQFHVPEECPLRPVPV